MPAGPSRRSAGKGTPRTIQDAAGGTRWRRRCRPVPLGLGGRVRDEACIGFSGPGLAGGRHGARPRRSLSGGPPPVRRSRRGAVAASLAADVRGAGERADADRKRAAGAAGGEPCGDPRARKPRAASISGGMSPMSPAIRSASIRRWPRRARSSVGDAARLVKRRGQAMQKAVPVGEGAMAALLGLDVAAARDGRRSGARRAGRRSARSPTTTPRARSSSAAIAARSSGPLRSPREHGARRSIMLPVSAPFHSPLMAPAAEVMAEALAQVRAAPRRWCRSSPMCRRARPAHPAEIERLLVEQVTAMVRWRESVLLSPLQGSRRSSRSAPGGCSPASSSASTAILPALSVGTAGRDRSPDQAPLSRRRADVRSDGPDRAGDRRLGRDRRRDRAGACIAQGAEVTLAGTRAAALAALAAELGERRPCRAGRSRRSGGARPPGARRRGGDGPGRHPGQQCRASPATSWRCGCRTRIGRR